MFKRWNVAVVVLTIFFLAGLFNALAGGPAHRSGIAGQVLLVQLLVPGSPVSPAVPLQVALLTFAKEGRHFRLIGKFETAPDGTFSVALPPGTYIVEPDPLSGYEGIGQLQVTVVPRQVISDEIDVISGDGLGMFPN
ncbi:MAG: hypothetical protein WBN22_14855 [Verrucomicrobiia bacterium]